MQSKLRSYSPPMGLSSLALGLGIVSLILLPAACGAKSGKSYGLPAQVSSITPTQGPTTGGTTIQVFGGSFENGAAVMVAGNNAQSVVYVSSSELIAITPAGSLGPADITVRNPNATPTDLPGAFTYIPDILQEALGIAGLTGQEFGWDAFEYSWLPPEITADLFRLSFYDAVHDVALGAPAYFQGLVDGTDFDAGGLNAVSDLIGSYSVMLDRPITVRNPVHNPDPVNPLAQAVADLILARGGVPNLTNLQTDAADVPLELQEDVARIVLAIRDAAGYRDAALSSLVPADVDFFYDYLQGFIVLREDAQLPNPAFSPNKAFLSETVTYQDMYQGGYDLARTVENLGLQWDPAYIGFSFNQPTPIGRIIIEDNADHVYDPSGSYSGDIALVLDTGGNDTYRISAGGNTRTAPVSVAIDLGGNDIYGYVVVSDPDDTGNRLPSDGTGRAGPGTPYVAAGWGPFSLSDTPRQGGGRLGVGLLFDYGAGTDDYQSLRMSQGFGCLGVGALFDDGGDDTYRGECGVQGSGMFGIGILVDLGGADSYVSYNVSQGFGYVLGAGILFDLDGDDSYFADEGADPLYYTPQDPGSSNSSFCQGAGFGMRWDALGEWWSGGIGLLRDVAGADTYWASIFAQGTGYWYGTGVLADSAGDDFYDAKWYVQAGAAHFAMAMFLEGGGNDTYNSSITPMNVLLGGGHDYSLAMAIEESGDDSYRSAGLSLGAGNVNGIGLFADNLGADTYDAIQDNALGSATADGADATRQARKTIGFFLDARSDLDVYIKPTANVGNDMFWTQAQTGMGIELGVGVDRPNSDTTLHFE